jgi:(2Fe-2S) ferredoxin
MIYRKASAVQQSKANGVDDALANMKIEDREGQEVVLDVDKAQEDEGNGEAAQCIWLARVRPEDCENIVRYTVLQGKVVKPQRQLRGGFDRTRQLVSW